MLRRMIAVVAAVALAVGALGACGDDGWEDRCRSGTPGLFECPPGDRPPPVALAGRLLDGGSYDVEQDRGKVVVVNLWSSWCAPCRVETAHLERTHQATRDRGVVFVGVNGRDDRDKAIAFERGRVTYGSIYDPDLRLGLNFQIMPASAPPTTYILDRAGRIAVVIRTSTVEDELRPLVERIAAEAPADGTR